MFELPLQLWHFIEPLSGVILKKKDIPLNGYLVYILLSFFTFCVQILKHD